MLFWPIRASISSIYGEKKLIGVVLQGAYENNVKISRNIARKSKNSEILNFLKNLSF